MVFEGKNLIQDQQQGDDQDNQVEEEFSPETVEALMEAAVLYGQKHNEGQNAVIFRVEVSKLPPEALQKIFTEKNKKIPVGGLASKVIKVYVSAVAAKEAGNHQQIFELINKEIQDSDQPMARIPEPHVNAELPIRTPSMKSKLEEAGIQIHSDKIGIMMMDYINGIDLMTHVYRQIIKNLPEDQFKLNYPDVSMIKKQLVDDPDSVDFAKLEEAIIFALAIQGGKAGEGDEDRIRRDLGNRKRVFDAFQSLGLTIDPEILNRVRRTVSFMNKNGIYHNDLHERNIMIETDQDGELVDVFLIDFDKVSGTKDESWGGDMGVVGEYGKLTKTKEELRQDQQDREMKGITDYVEKLKKARKKQWDTFMEQIEDLIGKKYPKLMQYLDNDISHFSMTHGNVSPEKLAVGIIIEIAKNDPKLAIEFIEYKRQNSRGGDRPFINLLNKILPSIQSKLETED